VLGILLLLLARRAAPDGAIAAGRVTAPPPQPAATPAAAIAGCRTARCRRRRPDCKLAWSCMLRLHINCVGAARHGTYSRSWGSPARCAASAEFARLTRARWQCYRRYGCRRRGGGDTDGAGAGSWKGTVSNLATLTFRSDGAARAKMRRRTCLPGREHVPAANRSAVHIRWSEGAIKAARCDDWGHRAASRSSQAAAASWPTPWQVLAAAATSEPAES